VFYACYSFKPTRVHLKPSLKPQSDTNIKSFKPTRTHLKPYLIVSQSISKISFKPTRVHLKQSGFLLLALYIVLLQTHKGSSETVRIRRVRFVAEVLQTHKGSSETLLQIDETREHEASNPQEFI